MDVAVIDNEGEDEDSIVSKAWIKIKGICPHDSDRRTMLWLYGTHLSAMQFF